MSIIGFFVKYKYLALFAAAIVEGPIAMTATGFLYRLGQIELLPAFVLLLLGDVIADIGWYSLGYFGAHRLINRYGHYISLTEPVMEKVKSLYRQHQGKIIFFSKISMGFGFSLAVLITAGISKVPLKKFILLNLLGGTIWTGILILLGYFFGNLYTLLDESLRIAFLAFILVAVLSAMYGFSRYMRGRLLKMKNGL